MAINLGDINFGLGPDTRRLEQARREVVAFGHTVNQAARDQSEGARRVEADLRRQEKALVSTLNQVLRLNDAVRKTGADARHIQDTTRMFERLTQEVAHGRVTALQFQRSMEDVQSSIGRTNRGLAQHVDAQKRADKAMSESNRQMKEQADYALRVDRMLQSATRQVSAYNAAVARIKAPDTAKAGMSGLAGSALSGLRGSLSGGMLDPAQMQRAQQTFMNAMQGATNSVRSYGHESSKTVQALERLANISILLHGPLSGIASRFALIASLSEKVSLSTAAVVTGISGAAFAFVQLSQGAIATEKAYQRVERGLNAVNETASLTSTEMKYLARFSDQAGAKFSDVSQQFVRLKAAAKGTNLEGAATREIFESIVAAGTTMGSTTEEIQGTLRALEQIMSKGTVQAEELRGQLGDRLPGAFGIMAKALNVTTAELAAMMKQGQVTSDALLPFARELRQRLGIDLKEAIEGTVAAEQRMSNALGRLFKSFNDTFHISEAYEGVLNKLSAAFDWVAANMAKFGQAMGILGGVFAGAMVAMAGPLVIAGFALLARTIMTVVTAVKTLNVAMMANPIGGFLGLLTKLAFAVGGAVVGMEVMNGVMGNTKPAENMSDAIIANEQALLKAASASAQFRGELEAQIQIQQMAAEAAFDEAIAQMEAARARTSELQKRSTMKGLPGWDILIGGALGDAERQAAEASDAAGVLNEQLSTLDSQLARITDLRTKLGEGNSVISPVSSGSGSESGMNKIANAMRDAQQEIARAREEYELLMVPAGQREFMRMQNEVNKSIDEYTERLIEAKVPAETIAALTNQYAAALGALKEKEYELQYFPDLWQELGAVLGQGVNTAFDQLIDNIIAGEDALTGMKDIAKAVVTDMIKQFALLAVINPLKNMFGMGGGQQQPAFSFGGNGGGGNFLGNLISGFFGGNKAPGLKLGYNLPGFAGGGEFDIGGGRGTGGVDNKLVQFMGKSGEHVSVTKSGHSSGGSDDGVTFAPQFIIQANGSKEVYDIVQQATREAWGAFNATSLQTQQANTLKGQYRRIPGMRR